MLPLCKIVLTVCAVHIFVAVLAKSSFAYCFHIFAVVVALGIIRCIFVRLFFHCYRQKHVAVRDLYTRDMQYTLSVTTESFTFLVALLSLRSVASSFWFSDSVFFYYFVTSYTFCSFLVRMNPRFSLFVLCLIPSFPLRWTLIVFSLFWLYELTLGCFEWMK